MTNVTIRDSLTLKNGRVIKNRLLKSAMSEQLGTRDHNPDHRLVNVYRQWSKGGCGLLVTGNVMVDRNHLGEPGNVALDEQSDLEAFKAWAAAGTEHGNELWVQLNHPGKQTPNFITKVPVAPSAISLTGGLEKGFNTPRALTGEEVEGVIQKFATAARLCKEAGFTGVQIHGAHGYLVSQFLSPNHNQRDDQWGGSIENRMRFALEVYKAMRREVGENYPIGIKLNSADFKKGGFTEEESMLVVQALAEAGIDLVEISGGTYESPEMAQETAKASTREREAFFMDYAKKIRDKVDVVLCVTGGFRSARGMNQALAENAMDMVGLARTFCIDPALPNHAIADDNYVLDLPHLTTGIKLVDFIAVHNIYWYQTQLQRMAKNKQPKPNMSPWRSFGATMVNNGRYAFRKVRA